MLLRKREALVVQERRQRELAERQRDNVRAIVSKLVHEEQRRFKVVPGTVVPAKPRLRPQRRPSPAPAGDATPSPSGHASEGEEDEGEEEGETESMTVSSSTPAGWSVGEGDDLVGGRRSPLSISAEYRARLQRLMDTAVNSPDDSTSSSQLPSSENVSLTEMERDWALHRPSQPEQRPPVTSDPCPFSWKPDVIEFRVRRRRCYRLHARRVNISELSTALHLQ